MNNRVCSIYDDHSMYIWDITDIKKIGKNRSFLYHNGAIWGLDVSEEFGIFWNIWNLGDNLVIVVVMRNYNLVDFNVTLS